MASCWTDTSDLSATVDSLLEGAAFSSYVQGRFVKNCVIIISDLTRRIPNANILPPLLKHLHQGGLRTGDVSIIVATGTHHGPGREGHIRLVGQDVANIYTIRNHDCDRDLIRAGILSSGLAVDVNAQVYEADFVITIGKVEPHLFAGFSGGPKMIFPGVAGRAAISDNHAKKIMSALSPLF